MINSEGNSISTQPKRVPSIGPQRSDAWRPKGGATRNSTTQVSRASAIQAQEMPSSVSIRIGVVVLASEPASNRGDNTLIQRDFSRRFEVDIVDIAYARVEEARVSATSGKPTRLPYPADLEGRVLAIGRPATADRTFGHNGGAGNHEGAVMAVNPNRAKDLRMMPLYTASEAACYLSLPASTTRAWAFGQGYRYKGARRRFHPVIDTADREGRRLSFINLVELLVLSAIRRRHRVSLVQVRKAVDYLKRESTVPHPLAANTFLTNGVDLFVDKFGQLLNISRDGQLAMRELIESYLNLVARDTHGIPVKLHLPLRTGATMSPGPVVIDPRIAFGRPVIDGTGVRTDVVRGRFRAGDSIEALAADYGLSSEQIQDVFRSEMPVAA